MQQLGADVGTHSITICNVGTHRSAANTFGYCTRALEIEVGDYQMSGPGSLESFSQSLADATSCTSDNDDLSRYVHTKPFVRLNLRETGTANAAAGRLDI